MENCSVENGWTTGQVDVFARRIAQKWQGAWFALADDLRDAVVASYVIDVLYSQERSSARITDVKRLHVGICRRLQARYRMSTPTASIEATDD